MGNWKISVTHTNETNQCDYVPWGNKCLTSRSKLLTSGCGGCVDPCECEVGSKNNQIFVHHTRFWDADECDFDMCLEILLEIFIFCVKPHRHIHGCHISCKLIRPPLHPGAQELEGTFSLAGTLLSCLSLQVAQGFCKVYKTHIARSWHNITKHMHEGHVPEALWMEGVWSWADNIQAIHSESSSYGLRNCSGISKKNFGRMRFLWMENQCLQDEGVDCSSHHMGTFVLDFEGF